MPAPLIIPDHIKQARLAALTAGIPCAAHDPAAAALMLAAVAYNRIPQVNIAEMLRQDLTQANRELHRVGNELLTESNRVKRLQSEVRRLQVLLGCAALSEAVV
jgi:cob(I)alamin adenosyltransferase